MFYFKAEVMQKIRIRIYHYWLCTEIEQYLTLFFHHDFTTLSALLIYFSPSLLFLQYLFGILIINYFFFFLVYSR